jgi:hypothetical protein
MRRLTLNKVAPALAAFCLAILSGCQQAQPVIGGGGYGGLPGMGAGGCVPITSPISFTAQNIYQDYARLIGGFLPYSGGQPIGQVMVGGYGMAGGGAYPGGYGGYTYASQNGSDGYITMTLSTGMYGMGYGQMQIPYQGYPYQNAAPYPNAGGFNQIPWNGSSGYVPGSWNPNTMSAMGSLQLSQLVIQDIMLQSQMGMFGYGGMGGMGYGMGPCVSGISFQLSKWDQTGMIYNGNVYLYLNGTQNGYVLYF